MIPFEFPCNAHEKYDSKQIYSYIILALLMNGIHGLEKWNQEPCISLIYANKKISSKTSGKNDIQNSTKSSASQCMGDPMHVCLKP